MDCLGDRFEAETHKGGGSPIDARGQRRRLRGEGRGGASGEEQDRMKRRTDRI